MKFFLFGVMLIISTQLIRAEEACLFLNQNELSELSTAVCSASTHPEVAVDKEVKKKFEKIYYNSEYQDKMTSVAAANEAKAQKNNLGLWMDVGGAKIKELLVNDKSRLESMVKAAYPAASATALKAKMTSIETALKGKANFSVSYTENKLKRDLLQVMLNDSSFKTEKESISTNVASSFGKSYKDEQDKKLINQLSKDASTIITLENEKKPSPVDKAYWVAKYSDEKPFKPEESQAYEIHQAAYDKYKDKLFQKYDPKIQSNIDKYGPNSSKVQDLQKKLEKETAAIYMGSPGKMAFTPPDGITIDNFLAIISQNNPTFFNCRASYGPDKAGYNLSENPETSTPANPDPEEDKERAEPQSEYVPESKTCDLNAQFSDDDFTATEDIKKDMAGCFADIPADAINVKINIESCASTVRSTKFKGKGENFELSRQRNETLKNLVPAKYKVSEGENITQNYFGKNKIPGQPPKWSGTCGPWVTEVGEERMSPNNCGNTNNKFVDECNSKSPDDKFASKYNPSHPYSWLCTWKDGAGYKGNQALKDDLKKYRYNKLVISYEVKKKVEQPPVVNPTQEPAVAEEEVNVPSEENKAFVLSKPHITCLYPRLKHESYRSPKQMREEAWNDFQGYLGSINLGGGPSSGGSRSGGKGGKGSIACPIF